MTEKSLWIDGGQGYTTMGPERLKYEILVIYHEIVYHHSAFLWALGLKSKNLGGVK